MKIRLLTVDDWQIWKDNLGGIRFYQKQGFKIDGTEPRALKIGDTFFDEHLMALVLTE